MNKNRKPSSQRGYDARWHKVRKAKLRANPLCEECCKSADYDSKEMTKAVAIRLGKWKISLATMVHHIKPINEGGDPLLWDNLMSLCEPCHDKKHSRNSLGNIGGCGIDGLPINAQHPWNKRR